VIARNSPSTCFLPSLAVAALLCLAACGSEVVVHNLGEREANKIIELLAENEVSTQKTMLDTGRSVSYSISVPTKSRIEAIRLLNRFEIPRRADSGYSEVFKDGGLIPTAGEEKAKQLSALEGEIEKQLRLVDGILDVQVQLVQPEESALRTAQDVRSPVTASVTIKYHPGAGGAKPLSEPQVQAVVAAGVERLTPDNVVVVMTPTGPMSNKNLDRADADAHGGSLSGVKEKNLRLALVVFVGVVVALSLVLMATQMRLRTVRGRFERLQNEIAKARRKPNGDSGPPLAP
jgi:type III secretion system YscJ/HrcJ family lipoprotein